MIWPIFRTHHEKSLFLIEFSPFLFPFRTSGKKRDDASKSEAGKPPMTNGDVAGSAGHANQASQDAGSSEVRH